MSAEELIRGFIASLAALMIAWVIWDRSDNELTPLTPEEPSRQRYAPYISNALLPVLVWLILVIGFVTKNVTLTLELWMSACLGIFLHTSFYYLLLMLLIPVFRKYISARACATLWLLPNYLYFTLHGSMQLDRPAWVLPVSKTFISVFCVIWLAGFAVLMSRSCVSHLILRRRLLKNAVPVTDPEILALWKQIQLSAGYKKTPYRLVVSPDVATPLSVGFRKRTIRVILPRREYTPEELELIFRHELVHIGREDSGTKFFFAFCTAICWFNPLMWIAMGRSADDLELSCDETVLLDADETQRRRYADLLLRTAGEASGFTTCLSASARTLRYRLQNVVRPRRRFSGALAVALVFFLLILSCGYFSLSYPAGSGRELIFDGQDPALCAVNNINFDTPDGYAYATCRDPQALCAYLEELEFYALTGSYSFSNDENRIIIIFHGPKGAFGVNLTDHTLKITPLYDDTPQKTGYYLREAVDWEYIRSLLVIK